MNTRDSSEIERIEMCYGKTHFKMFADIYNKQHTKMVESKIIFNYYSIKQKSVFFNRSLLVKSVLNSYNVFFKKLIYRFDKI